MRSANQREIEVVFYLASYETRCYCKHRGLYLRLESACLCIYITFVFLSRSFSPRPLAHTPAVKQAQPMKRPIQIGPKVSIQPRPLITAVPLAHAAAPLQAKTIIIQPLQTTVLPVVKPAPVNIQPAPPAGQNSHCTTSRHTDSRYTVLHQTPALGESTSNVLSFTLSIL